jgi:hypothetical protein
MLTANVDFGWHEIDPTSHENNTIHVHFCGLTRLAYICRNVPSKCSLSQTRLIIISFVETWESTQSLYHLTNSSAPLYSSKEFWTLTRRSLSLQVITHTCSLLRKNPVKWYAAMSFVTFGLLYVNMHVNLEKGLLRYPWLNMQAWNSF